MGRSLDWLTDEIKAQAGSRVEPHALEQWIHEVRAHVEASTTARMELGLDEQAAESEAVRAFGDPKKIATSWVEAIRPEGEVGPDAVMVSVSVVATLLYLCFWLFATAGSSWKLLAGGSIAFAIFLAIRSHQCRSFQGLVLAKLGVASALGTVLVFAVGWLDLERHGGAGVMRRHEVTNAMRQIESGLAHLRAQKDEIAEGRKALAASADAAKGSGFFGTEGYRIVACAVPGYPAYASPGDALMFHRGLEGSVYAYRAQFEQTVQARQGHAPMELDDLRNRIDFLERNDKAIREAVSAGFMGSLRDTGVCSLWVGLLWSLGMLLVHSLVWLARTMPQLVRKAGTPCKVAR